MAQLTKPQIISVVKETSNKLTIVIDPGADFASVKSISVKPDIGNTLSWAWATPAAGLLTFTTDALTGTQLTAKSITVTKVPKTGSDTESAPSNSATIMTPGWNVHISALTITLSGKEFTLSQSSGNNDLYIYDKSDDTRDAFTIKSDDILHALNATSTDLGANIAVTITRCVINKKTKDFEIDGTIAAQGDLGFLPGEVGIKTMVTLAYKKGAA